MEWINDHWTITEAVAAKEWMLEVVCASLLIIIHKSIFISFLLDD